MNWQFGKQIRDKKVITAGGVGAIVFLLSLLLLIYAGQQSLAGTEENPFQGIWFVLLVFTLVSIPLILSVLLTLFCRELTKRKSAEEQLTEFQERLRSLTSQLSLAEERERRRIAVYLHDNIGQKLAISSIKLGQLKDAALAAESEPLVAGLNEIRLLFKQIIQDTKSLTFKISSPILYELGLEAAVEWLTEELQNQHAIPTYFEDDNQPKPLDEDLRVLVFQAVNELLLNVVKHARARHVQVSMWRHNGQMHIGIHDDGVGFNVTEMSSRWGRKDGGFGLFSIRERLKAFGGNLDVKSTSHGTTITLSAPLQKR
jgi:signal transduction histidine kinase